MRLSTRGVAVAVLVIAILVPSVKKWLRTSLPVTEVDMTDKVIIVTGVFNVSRLSSRTTCRIQNTKEADRL